MTVMVVSSGTIRLVAVPVHVVCLDLHTHLMKIIAENIKKCLLHRGKKSDECSS